MQVYRLLPDNFGLGTVIRHGIDKGLLVATMAANQLTGPFWDNIAPWEFLAGSK